MDELRASTPDDRRALKAAVRRAGKLAGGFASVCHVTRVGESDLSKYAGIDHADRHCPVDVALELDREAGSPVIVATMAGLLGYRLVSAGAAASGGVCLREVARVAVESADVVAAVAAALADGKLDAADLTLIDREVEEACKVLRSVQARVRGAVAKGGSDAS